MKRLILAGAMLLSALAGAERYALIVAIDSYPIIKPPERQLSGSAYDLRLVRKMLEFYKFQTEQLARADATRVAIITKLEEIRQKAKAGDDVVFYFSGRGSIAPPADKPTAKAGMEPTIVPYDGKENSTDFDLRMKRIEDWAESISKAGAKVTIILDASFQSATRDDFGRPYNPTPRTLKRKITLDGDVREQPYLGPGVYLAATPSGGSSYEYLVNTSRNVWAGAFTDMLVNEVIAQLRKGQSPTYAGAMREVQAYFKDKVRQDYMPGLSPFPPAAALIAKADIYDQPMFGGTTPNDIPPPQKQEIVQMDEQRKQTERKLRIGLSFPAVRDRANTRGDDDPERDPKVVAELAKLIQAKIPSAEIVPYGAPVDTVVAFVKQQTGAYEARIFGDEVDRKRDLRFAGKTVKEIFDGGLGDQLELQALTLRIFRIIEDESPISQAEFNLVSDRPGYRPSDPFKLDFVCGVPAKLYIFDRDDADGIVQMTFPAATASDNLLPKGSLPLEGAIDDGSPSGKMLVRALFVEADLDLPKLESTSETAFRKSLLQHLRVLVPAIESKKAKWATKEISLTINP